MIINIILVLLGILSLVFGFFIYLKEPKNATNISFLLVALVGGFLWNISIAFFGISTKIEELYFWDRMIYVSAIFSPFVALLFSRTFPRSKFNFSFYDWIIYFAPILILLPILFFTDGWIREILINPDGTKEVLLGPAYMAWIIYIVSYFIWSGIILILNCIKAKPGIKKTRYEYVLVGLLFPILGCLPFNVIAPYFGIYDLIWVGPLSISGFILVLSFGVLKYQLFKVKIIFLDLLVIFMGLLLFTLPFVIEDQSLKILTFLIFLLFCFFSWYLIKMIHKEERLRLEAQKLNKVKTEFLSIASHQLRTPLTAIRGYISMLKEGDFGKLEKEPKEAVDNVYISTMRMIKIINDLLNTSRLESGKKINLDIKEFEFGKEIKKILKEMKVLTDGKKLELKWENELDFPLMVNADSSKVKQIIGNIIDNCIHYTETGGITVTTKRVFNKLIIEICDSGVGMCKDDLKNLFQLFSRGEAAKLYTQGAGMGLYIVKEFVKMHKGKIYVSSKGRDKGSCFYIELPIIINN